MKIIIDIGHPGHVHLFKNFAKKMLARNYAVLFTLREKEHETRLISSENLQYIVLGKKRTSKFGKVSNIIFFTLRIFNICLKYKPDIFISHGSFSFAWVSSLIRKPHIALEDTGNKEQVRLYKPFTEVILTSDVFPYDYGKKQIRYKSHHELAYLMPKYFTPNKNIFSELKIPVNSEYAILRFVSWNASHDIGQKGLSESTKLSIIELLEKNNIKVFISSERELPKKIKKYRITIVPEQMHSALYHTRVFIGEGTTMAMEAGILGTPSVYVNSLQYMNIKDLENYGLVFSFSSEHGLIKKISEILLLNKIEFSKKAEKLLKEKIDLTSFLAWFVENYPESFQIMKENPDYQYNFK